MSKIYYVDSENVGGNWIDLLNDEEENDFLVFYTGHSPRIDYEHAISLMNAKNKPQFIHCYEGNNALDFQLVSYLGYQLRSDENREIIIVSNDTGFDAVINFWMERGMNIRRLVTNCVQINDSKIEEEPVSSDEVTDHQIVDVNAKLHGVEKKELYTIINCMGASDTSNIHLAYVHFYGNKKGEEIYRHMKSEKFVAPPVPWKKETKVKKFLELVFKYCNTTKVSMPDDLSAFLCSSMSTNDDKKTMQKKISKKYGGNADKIHKILKPFYKSIAKMK